MFSPFKCCTPIYVHQERKGEKREMCKMKRREMKKENYKKKRKR
jgi:hypothetical protein